MSFRKPAAPAASATSVPGYTGLDEIGGGAFATVYRATETDTGRQVALKILKLDTVHPHLIQTFEQEIRALAKVSDHPNIVTLYRPMSTPDGRPALVLELCRESFAEQLRRSGVLDAQSVTRVGVKIAGALESAHRHGFLHRDLKPQNLLVTQFGEPALADFGVAALQASAQSTAGVFGFTTLHSAPEILEGHQLRPETDVYGLASTMYQLLTGRAPFAAFDNEAPASVILRILRDPVRPLRSDFVPIQLSDLLEVSLSKDPGGRPHTAEELAKALQGIEASWGWPVTSYAAWGEPQHPASSGSDRLAGQPPSSQPQSRLYASGPSVHVESAKARRVTPATSPGESTAGATDLGLARHAGPPPSRPPPPARIGPSLEVPGPTARNVVVPDSPGPGRGQPGPPLAPPDAPLAPLWAPETGLIDRRASQRPASSYADPTDCGRLATPERGGPPASVYEETALPSIRTRRAAADTGPRRRVAVGAMPAATLAGLAAAAVVVILAVLLAAGIV